MGLFYQSGMLSAGGNMIIDELKKIHFKICDIPSDVLFIGDFLRPLCITGVTESQINYIIGTVMHLFTSVAEDPVWNKPDPDPSSETNRIHINPKHGRYGGYGGYEQCSIFFNLFIILYIHIFFLILSFLF